MIYLGVAFLILCALAGATALYVWKYGNPLKNGGATLKQPAGAPGGPVSGGKDSPSSRI
jgi:hypothetical protein